jgi:hypothetical protein
VIMCSPAWRASLQHGARKAHLAITPGWA